MKILCVCNHGNVRSAALARAIKDISITEKSHTLEAIAIGAQTTTQNTMEKLSDWADKIIWLSEKINPETFEILRGDNQKSKIINLTKQVGPDHWFNPFHPELNQLMKKIAKEITQ